MQRLSVLFGLSLLSACATTEVPTVPTAPPTISGMEQVLGKPAETAIQLLGQTRLDRMEGPARQLQFAGACLLDIYYYAKPGTPAIGTYAEARLPNGQSLDAAQCFQSLLAVRKKLAAPR